jgi:hypothetical protein
VLATQDEMIPQVLLKKVGKSSSPNTDRFFTSREGKKRFPGTQWQELKAEAYELPCRIR